MDWIYEPWPWYVAGPLIALTMFLLLYAGKQFGMSSNLRTMCSIGGAGKYSDFFKFDWKSQRWNLTVVLGSVIGGFIASQFLSNNTVEINPKTTTHLSQDYGIESAGSAYLPTELFASENLADPFVLIILILGGFLVGFGARYAGGCTSGHAISGLSNLQLPSLIAVIGFFIGGLVMVHLLFPLIFS
ncbi:YeeE/YedE thiosulfate transporter family protein [Maribacter sp. PR1]|uniref:YeeE/YedE thiosulfate transporter family protein n=1 Tax=Maribacter cobaltidurans TaxID=1178778 RepID=A0ABU7IV16_9FLAO|nr:MULTISPECIES: YeeE/YedE thiosulfate transporter family protein [Maribacter]MDC6389290.1 YeeE/YedE thiosulfate transporter family protein [Maribacter sp. PR1]MEE1976678.1 YeeE/YedE thiosulfate transporter family protein [Maribacter cobaltidurans]